MINDFAAIQWPFEESIVAITRSIFTHYRLIVILYILTVGIILVRLHYTKKVIIPLQKTIDSILDAARYKASLLLYKSGSSLHNKDETLSLLLHYKKEYLEQWWENNTFEKIYQEYIYIHELLTGEQLAENEKDTINNYSRLIDRFKKTKQNLSGMLSFLTLWISRLLQ